MPTPEANLPFAKCNPEAGKIPMRIIVCYGGTIVEYNAAKGLTRNGFVVPSSFFDDKPAGKDTALLFYEALMKAKELPIADGIKSAPWLKFLDPLVNTTFIGATDISSIEITNDKLAGIYIFERDKKIFHPNLATGIVMGTDNLTLMTKMHAVFEHDRWKSNDKSGGTSSQDLRRGLRAVHVGAMISEGKVVTDNKGKIRSDARVNVQAMARAAGKDIPHGSYIAFTKGKKGNIVAELYPAISVYKRSPSTLREALELGAIDSPYRRSKRITLLKNRQFDALDFPDVETIQIPHFSDTLTVESLYDALESFKIILVTPSAKQLENDLRIYSKEFQYIILHTKGSGSLPKEAIPVIKEIADAGENIFILSSNALAPSISLSGENEKFFDLNNQLHRTVAIAGLQLDPDLLGFIIARGILENRSPMEIQEFIYDFCSMGLPEYSESNSTLLKAISIQ